MTSEGGVVNVIASTMLLRNDVLYVVSQFGMLLPEQAIFHRLSARRRTKSRVAASIATGRSDRVVAGL